MKILLVEDEPELILSISEFLKKEGYICEKAGNYLNAEDKLASYQYDLIILDITLPDGNGLDLIPFVKKVQPDETRIIILSAKNSLDDKLSGLDLGADDYLTKPFYMAELHSRIQAIARRKNFNGKKELLFNEITIEVQEKQVYIHQKAITLTKKEYDFLLYLVTNKNRILTKENIAEHLWGDYIDMADNFDFVYTHMKNIRKKLLDAGCENYLKTVYGMGYKFSE